MERKVIKQGNDTLTMTLPRDWSRKYNVKPGDSLFFEIKDNILAIHGNKVKMHEPVNFNINFSDNQLLKWTIGSLYRIGFEEIHLSYSDPEVFSKIQKLVKDTFVGFVITNEGKNSCVVKSMSTDDPENIPALMNRCFLVVLSFAENCHEALKNKNFKKLKYLIYLHENSDQLIRLCQRILIKNAYSNVTNSCFYLTLLENLEILCDDYRDICNNFTNRKVPFKNHKELIYLLFSINSIFEKLIPLVLNYKEEKITPLIGEIKTNIEKINLICSNNSQDEIIFLFYLKSIADLIKNFFPTLIIINISSINLPKD